MREDEAKKVTQTQAKLEEIRKLIERNNQALSELKNRRDESSNRRKELWREDTENDSAIQSYKAELAKAERVLNSTGRHTVATFKVVVFPGGCPTADLCSMMIGTHVQSIR
jgi:chromosome segregation ATPase